MLKGKFRHYFYVTFQKVSCFVTSLWNQGLRSLFLIDKSRLKFKNTHEFPSCCYCGKDTRRPPEYWKWLAFILKTLKILKESQITGQYFQTLWWRCLKKLKSARYWEFVFQTHDWLFEGPLIAIFGLNFGLPCAFLQEYFIH